MAVQKSSWPHLRNLALADGHCAKPGPIDVLIGMDEMDTFLRTGLCKVPTCTAVAQKTISGWVLFGKAMRLSNSNTNLQSPYCDVQLIKMVCFVTSNFKQKLKIRQKKHHLGWTDICKSLYVNQTGLRSSAQNDQQTCQVTKRKHYSVLKYISNIGQGNIHGGRILEVNESQMPYRGNAVYATGCIRCAIALLSPPWQRGIGMSARECNGTATAAWKSPKRPASATQDLVAIGTLSSIILCSTG
ncbi:unnamed protein product [Ceratitis capitata]|uniref:(Mediterranean fruit fly) hypothetical protein n=1 Tax=Ceratitis capitata TaxID=7213 RepID=A0A811UPV6_CERCA|nr:unnamed protein product [Ceratitis capitata]